MRHLLHWFGTHEKAAAVRFDDSPMTSGRLYAGAVQTPVRLDAVLGRLSAEGQALWLDASGASGGIGRTDTLLVRTEEEDIFRFLDSGHSLHAFDLAIVTLSAGFRPRSQNLRSLQTLLQASSTTPLTVWVCILVGECAERDPLHRAIVRNAVPLRCGWDGA